jgi:plasmid stabilization system protein ParE
MTRRLRLTTYALADLEAIFAFLAARHPTAAQRYVSRLREQCDVYLTNRPASRDNRFLLRLPTPYIMPAPLCGRPPCIVAANTLEP